MLFYKHLNIELNIEIVTIAISAFSNTDYIVIHFLFMSFYTTREWPNIAETCRWMWIL